MDANGRKDVITLGGVAIAAALICGWLVVRSPQHHAATASDAVPVDTFVYGSIDVRAFADTPLGKAFVTDDAKSAKEPGRESILGMGAIQTICGFDPLLHIRTFAVAVPESNIDFGMAAAGDLTREQLAKCARELAARNDKSLREQKEGSFTLLYDQDSEAGASIAMRDGGPFLVGRGPWMKRMLDTVEGRAPSVATSPSHGAMRADLARQDADAKALVVSAILPESMRDQLRQQFVSEATANGGADAAMTGVLGVSAAGLALHPGRGGKDDTRITAELRCDNAESCKKVETLILHQRLGWSGDLRLRMGGLGPLIDSLETSFPSPTTLLVRAHMPAEELARLAKRYLSMAPSPAVAPGKPR